MQIIGGGTAGLTVAQRLAENPQLSVAVIEGGSFYEIDNGNYSQIPAYDVQFSSPDPASIQPLVDWGIIASPQAVCCAFEHLFVESSPTPYHVGDQSFTFERLLAYFRKSPHFTPPDYAKRGPGSSLLYSPDAFSSDGGPLQVSYTNFYQPFSTYVKLALQKLGLQNIPGMNSGSLLGFSEFTLTVDPVTGVRSSSETSFLQAAIANSTLQVYHRTVAKKVVFDNEKRAKSVLVETAGVMYELSARKEHRSTVNRSAGWEKIPRSLRGGLSNGTLTDLAKFPGDWPELELLPLASAAAPAADSDNYAIASIALLTTTSRGNVTILSDDTNQNPVVSLNWLLTATDREIAVAGFKRARQLAAATGITVGPEVLPGAEVQTDEQILDFIRGTVGPIHHASATCAMGRRNNTNAVVDSKAKVFGVQGLRVVDASAFPLLPPGHPQASVYMLAEKIADDILKAK
ncbi:MAG: hypothetical protein Q9199_000777 [Rusavskia elegans]